MPRRLDVPDHEIDARPTIYLVRLWVAPADPTAAWAMDDWLLDDSTDIVDTLVWADRQGATAFEVFARTDPEHEWIRLRGLPADGRETVIRIPLTTA